MFNRIFVFIILVFSATASKSADIVWRLDNKALQQAAAVYREPYQTDDRHLDKKLLTRNTVTLFGAGLGTMGFLYMMPSSFTNWEDDDDGVFEKWWDNISHGPVWDKDDLFLNYVTHPYAGAIYYIGARSAGGGIGYSTFYSFMLSTFFWECGIEAFAERPSIQDLIVTPVAGAFLGEWFYQSKRLILERDYELLGSKRLGKTAVFLMDPITEITQIIFDDTKQKDNISFASYPISSGRGLGYGFRWQYRF